MADQIFGAAGGYGVTIIEREAAQTIVPAALGTMLVVGRFERGEVDAPVVCRNPKEASKRLGGRINNYESPHVVDKYWEHSGGAGAVVGLRVTDGHEQTAYTTLYTRHWGTDFNAADSRKSNSPQIRRPCLRVYARSAGEWGGSKRLYAGAVANVSDVAETTVTTGVTMVEDQWAGATITIHGSGRSYPIPSNTTAGVLTLASDSKADTDLGSSTNKRYTILDEAFTPDGVRRELSVQVVESSRGPTYFSLWFSINGVPHKKYEDLTMDPESEAYAVDVVNDDVNNAEILLEDLLSVGDDRSDPYNRPANLFGRIVSATAKTLVYQPGQVVSNEFGASKLNLVKFDWAGTENVAARLTFTYSHSGTKLTGVAAINRDGGTVIAALPDLTVTTSTNDVAHDLSQCGLPTLSFDIGSIGSGDNGKTFVIDVLPFQCAEFAAVLYPKYGTAAKYKVRKDYAAAVNELSIESGDLLSVITEPTVASVTTSNAGTYATTGSTGLVLKVDGRPQVSITLTAGSSVSAATIASDINTAFAAAFPGGDLDNVASVTTDNKVKLTSPGGLDGGGPASTVEVVSGSSLTVLGLTAAVTYGTAGSSFLASYAQPCTGGFDGGEPTISDYQDVLGTLISDPLGQIDGKGLGLLTIVLPETHDVDIQQLAIDFAEAKDHYCLVNLDPDLADESEAVTVRDALIAGGNDTATRFELWFPSKGYYADPDRPAMKRLTSNLGVVAGLIARYAAVTGGYIKPPAGLDAVANGLIKLPTGNRVFDSALLRQNNINYFVLKGGKFVAFGDRTGSVVKKWTQSTIRRQMSHWSHVLRQSFEGLIFQVQSRTLWAIAENEINRYFETEHAKGLFRFERTQDSFSVVVDEQLNTPETMDAGALNASVTVVPATAVEEFVISMTKQSTTAN